MKPSRNQSAAAFNGAEAINSGEEVFRILADALARVGGGTRQDLARSVRRTITVKSSSLVAVVRAHTEHKRDERIAAEHVLRMAECLTLSTAQSTESLANAFAFLKRAREVSHARA